MTHCFTLFKLLIVAICLDSISEHSVPEIEGTWWMTTRLATLRRGQLIMKLVIYSYVRQLMQQNLFERDVCRRTFVLTYTYFRMFSMSYS